MNKTRPPLFRLLVILPMGLLILLMVFPEARAATQPQAVSISAQRVLNRVNQLLEKKEIEKAVNTLTSFKCDADDQWMIQFTLGNSQMMAKRYQEANAAYLKSVKADETYGPAWYNLANSYMELNRNDLAGEAFNTAYKWYDPKRPEILYYAASVFLAADHPKKALDAYDRLLVLHPEEVKPEWQEGYVRILMANHMPKAALPVIEQLIQQMQGDKKKEWREFLLYQYLSLNMEKKALVYARELTQKDPLESRWWKALTQVTMTRNRYKEALVALTVYSHLMPLTLDEKKLMADLCLMLHIPGQSVEVLEEIMADTYDPALVEKMVYGYAARHAPEKALRWIDKGLEADGKNVKLLMLKGDVLFQLKAYGDSEKVFRTVVNQDRTEGKAWLMMGYAAWYGQDIQTAISAMKEAAKFPKHQKVANEALDGLMRISRERS